MDKYRVRLRNGRVVGPFLPAQIIEMRQKGFVHGQENCQVFPSGDWLPLSQFEFWSNQTASSLPADGTFVINLGDLKDDPVTVEELIANEPEESAPSEVEAPLENVLQDAPAESLQEEAPGKDAPPDRRKRKRNSFREFDYRAAIDRREETFQFELEEFAEGERPKTLKEKDEEQHAQRQTQAKEDGAHVFQISPERIKEEQEKRRREEVQRKREEADKKRQEVEEAGTVVTPAGDAWRQHLEEEKRKQDEIKARWEKEEQKKREKAALAPILSDSEMRDAATQVINLDSFALLKSEARRAEADMHTQQEQERIALQRKIDEEEERRAEEEALARKEQEEELTHNRRKKMIFGLVGLLVIMAFFFPEQDAGPKQAKPIVPVEPVIRYPVPFDQKDPVKAKADLTEATKRLALDTYMGRRDAAIYYRSSYENNIDQKNLTYKLIRLYGWLIPHSGNFEADGATAFKLIRANKLVLPLDPDVCLGAALFYKALGKEEAAYSVLDRFVKSQANKPSKELFAAYLESLIDRNDEPKADEVAASLGKVEKKGIEVTLALIHYHRYKNHPEAGREVLELALDDHRKSVPLLISKAEFELEANDIKGLAKTVQSIRDLQAESSRLYFGRLMEFAGFVFAFQNKPGPAAEAFKEAMKYSDSELLQDKLTNIKNIDPGANDEASRLIKQIQARDLVKESERALKKFDFQTGLLTAIDAQSMESGYAKADYHLAEVQLRLGISKDAIETLETLQKENPTDKAANLALVKAYIDTYKFNDAKRMFTILAPEMRDTWQYASLNALMFERMGEINQSILWLQKAINLNPLNDNNIYSLAKLFVRAKNFGQAKNRLFQAMELDPSNIDYKLTYGSIIYETEGPDAAIAYLFGLLQQFPKNPSILGDIAIYYHRAGKTQQFLDTRKDIEALPVQDPRVYRFLIKSAVLDEKWEDAINYTNELIKLEPGELSAMMEMGRVLMSIKRYTDAAKWFVRVREKLPSYPKVGYFKALIELYVNNPDQALKDVSEDMKLNGQYEEGVVLMGDIYTSQEKYTDAEAQFKAALKINVKSPGAMRGLATLALKRGQLDVALDLFKRAVSEDKDNPDIHRQMGDVYRLQGQGSLAIEAYRVYLKLRPDAQDRPQVDEYIRILE